MKKTTSIYLIIIISILFTLNLHAGGLVIHIGCGEGKLTTALFQKENFIIQGLDTDREKIKTAQNNIYKKGLEGKVTARVFDGTTLPYIDNLINLVVVEDLKQVSLAEIRRILAPYGKARIKINDSSQKKKVTAQLKKLNATDIKSGKDYLIFTKPWPKEYDDWTHFMHGPDNNAVSKDTIVGIPHHIQWTGGPKWARHHEHLASLNVLVSSRGRLFYILDKGPKAAIQLPPDWVLAARDAFNGTILWEKKIPDWYPHLWPVKSGPAEITRRLVSEDKYIYVTLGYQAPVSQLSADSGKVVKIYKKTEMTREFILSDGVLFLLVDHKPEKYNEFDLKEPVGWDNGKRAKKEYPWIRDNHLKKSWIMAIETGSEKMLWKKESSVAPRTLAADSLYVCFFDGKNTVCLNRKTGKKIWSTETDKLKEVTTVSPPTLVMYKDVVLYATKKVINAFSLKTGKMLWEKKKANFGSLGAIETFIIDGLVWISDLKAKNPEDSGKMEGLDPKTGKVVKSFLPDIPDKWFHGRCYPVKASENYIFTARTGTEYVDLKNEHWEADRWLRGTCIHGIVLGNGLLYSTPHACACFIESQLKGFNGLANKRKKITTTLTRLYKGEAFGSAIKPTDKNTRSSWPTYRQNPLRNGITGLTIDPKIKQKWKTLIKGKLSAITIAEGKVFVSAIDRHCLYALDAKTGKSIWKFQAGGRVDSPPTIYKGAVFFGANDGCVYSLTAAEGKLVWKFRAAPGPEQLISYNRLESVWPVHGSVLIQNDTLYCVAGRIMFLDGGLRLFRLEPLTGKIISETVLNEYIPGSKEKIEDLFDGLSMPAALTDILSSDNKKLFMRSNIFDLDGTWPKVKDDFKFYDMKKEDIHLFSPAGFLDDNWMHRTYWMYGSTVTSGCNTWYEAGRYVPAGKLLVFDDSNIYGFGRKQGYFAWSAAYEYRFFSAERNYNPEEMFKGYFEIKDKGQDYTKQMRFNRLFSQKNIDKYNRIKYHWQIKNTPFQAHGLIKAGNILFAAGPPDVVDEEKSFGKYLDQKIRKKLEEQKQALAGKKGGLLWALSAKDGKKLSEIKIDSPPVFDGMAAAYGKIYMATKDGSIVAFGK